MEVEPRQLQEQPSPLVLLKTTFSITKKASPYYFKTIFVNEDNFHIRYVVSRLCNVILNRGDPCPNQERSNQGYCSRHLKTLNNLKVQTIPEKLILQDTGTRKKANPVYVSSIDVNDRYILIQLCKADTTNGSMCNNLPNAARGYCYTHWGMFQIGTLIEAIPPEPLGPLEQPATLDDSSSESG